MIKRFLLVGLTSVMLFFAGYSQAQAPQQEEMNQVKIKTKIVRLQIKPKIQVINQTYAESRNNYARIAQTMQRFPWGYCTWLVARKFPVTWSGNANMWITNARAQGYRISNMPKVGSIVQTREGRIGHVAYVIAVKSDKIQVIEMNYKGFGVTSYRWIPRNYWPIQGYIYRKS